MPANSIAQRRLMGMVHAAQDGELKNPSPEVKKVASSIKPKDAKDFASTPEIDLPSHVKSEATDALSEIAQYKKYGKSMKRGTNLRDIGEKLNKIAEMAEKTLTENADDWYDAQTLKRHIKEMKSYIGDFHKLAEEADVLEMRMEALYNDAGHILEQYFELAEDEEEHVAKGLPQTHEEEPEKLPEAEILYTPRNSKHIKKEAKYTVDEMTEKAIKKFHRLLADKNKTLAEKFRSLPLQKMESMAWKYIK